jgi:thioredoxin reductase (NADPH)
MPEHGTVSDVIIVGQGAAAYAAAIYAARYQIKTTMFGEEFGGETATGGVIENYPGAPAIDGLDLMLKFKEQVDALEVPIVPENVGQLRRGPDGWEVLAGETWHRGKTVIVACGRVRRTLGLANEKGLMGKGVSYCSTCDAPLYKNKNVVVVGGGDSALKGAYLIAKYAKQVYLSYRGDKFTRPEPIAIQRIGETANVEVVFNSVVKELKASDAGLTHVVFDLNRGQSNRTVVADGIFIEIGADPNSGFAKAAGATVNEHGELTVDKGMRTSLPGVFAAGDVANASGDLKQTITAAAQGAIAATSAYEYVTKMPRVAAAAK